MQVNNKTVWITGASSGIGEALARQLNAAGARVILSARRVEELERVKQTCAAPAQVIIQAIDLTKTDTFADITKHLIEKTGGIDILINNGGISQRSLAKDTTLEVDKQLMEVNYIGAIGLSKALLPHLLQKQSGKIVVITSAVGKFGSPWRSGYSASKHALHGYYDSLRAEIHADKVGVLLVCPGFVHTNITINALTADGTPLRSMDRATKAGLSADECARQIIKGIQQDKEEITVAGFKEKLGVWMKRHFPAVFSVMIRKMDVR